LKEIGGSGVSIPKKAVEGIREFSKTIEKLGEIGKGGLADLASGMVSAIGFDTALGESDKEEDQSRLENIYELENAMKSFAIEARNQGRTATLAEFLQTVSLVQDTDNSHDGDAVIISTIHSAKGLEFQNVFIIAAEDGIFPLARAKFSTNELEEERRLCYVAITRAAENLYFTYANSRFHQGTRLPARPSEFLVDCGLVSAPKPRNFDFY
jgi:DNA helicase-2/ATP-dependent DNA helicase PcrA